MIRVRDVILYPVLVPNLRYVKKLIKREILPAEVRYRPFSGSIYLKRIGCEASSRHNFFLLEGIQWANKLAEDCGARFWVDEEKKLHASLQELEFVVNSREELFAMYEVFHLGAYNVQITEEFVFVDIGMNVGITSLCFASMAKVSDVYAYEPFPDTYEAGMRNIERNKKFAGKIHAFKYGIGSKTEELVADYLPEFKGSVGVKGIPQRVVSKENEGTIRKEHIRMRAIGEVLAEIKAKHERAKLVVKIDCEGSEYDILRSLRNTQHLSGVDVVMIEWHIEGPGELVKILNDHGFSCFAIEPHGKDIGMIYATRQ
jgi:FkbM family methyltransferase